MASIKEILNKVDIIEIIEDFSQLTSSGKNFKILCKVHNDTNPSVVISQEKQIFKCFSCGIGGDALVYLQKFENKTLLESLKYLSQKYHLDLNLEAFSDDKKYNEEQKKLLAIFKDAANFFSYNLLIYKENNLLLKNFLTKRKLDQKLIEHFNLGFVPLEEESDYVIFLEKKNHDIATLINSSLINEKEKKVLSQKIIFPIKNEFGDIVAFSARQLINNEHESKYLNSKDSQIFKKSEIFYNYDQAKDYEELIICEGFMDVISLFKVNIKNSIALMGTALSQNHIKKLKNHKIILFLDGDNAGIEATMKSLEILIKNSIETSVVINELKKDPDEIINNYGQEKISEMLQNKISSFKYIYNVLLNKIDIKNENNIEVFLATFWNYLKFASQIVIGKFTKIISQDLNIDENDLNKIWKLNKVAIKTSENENNLVEILEINTLYSERLVLSVLNNEELFNVYLKKRPKLFDINTREALNFIEKKMNNPDEYLDNENEMKKYFNYLKTKHKIFPKTLEEFLENIQNIVKYDKKNINTYRNKEMLEKNSKYLKEIIENESKNKKEIINERQHKK
ncbi:MAG: DNA primase [Metamycoplasmataceae bacterium]